MGLGGGKNKSESRSTPVTWKALMTPWQKESMEKAAPTMFAKGMEGFMGKGLSDQQRATYKGSLMGNLRSLGGSQLSSLMGRAGGQGLTGGALEESKQGIGTGLASGLSRGLTALEDLNMQEANQKVANFLSWLTWNPPSSMKSTSSSSGWNADLSLPGD
jgi:hypothetical protein